MAAALAEARSTRQHQHYEAVAWLAALLLRTTPATQAAVTKQLLELPAVPLDCATQLVAAGLRITFAQLLAAVDSMVAGVEVWVQAQHHLGIPSNIPPVAVAMCCGVYWVSLVQLQTSSCS
jgi:hypothetical protein